MSDQVAVAEDTDAQVAEVEKRTDDVDPFDAALAEFADGTKASDSPPEPKAPAISKDEIAVIKAQAQEIQNERTRKEVLKTIEEIRGEVPADVFDDEFVEGWLNGLALKQPQLAVAFAQKGIKPKEWDKVKSSLSTMLSDKMKKLREKIQSAEEQADRAAVAHAVRGASTKIAADPPPDFSRMSNAEFQNWKRDNMK